MAVVTLGCARNEVDSEELAGRLAGDGYVLVDDADDADAVLVNTCGFIESAKKDSVDAILAATDSGAEVIAVGCMAERYGAELAGALPEATVLGFDDYAAIGDRLDDVLTGRPLVPHTPQDRRLLLPISPVQRTAAVAADDAPAIPGHDWLKRKRLASGPSAALKIASGCDRRCSFCAIPAFRGAFVSRPAAEVLGEARWLASQGVTEIVLVSENSTSYGKDMGDLRSLEKLLPQLAAVEGVSRVRVAYLQPAELRPGLLEVIADHARHRALLRPVLPALLAGPAAPDAPLRRHRRLPRASSSAPARWPRAPGFRTNVILGFPGETEDDVAELERFLVEGRLDAVGVFGYSDEEGTEAIGLRRQAGPGRDRRPGPADHRPGRGAHRAARRGADRQPGRGAADRGPRRVRGRRHLGRARRAPGPGRRRHDHGHRGAGRRRRRAAARRPRSSTPRASTCSPGRSAADSTPRSPYRPGPEP